MTTADPMDLARLREAFASLSGDESREAIDAGRIFDALHGRLAPEARQAVVDELLVNPEAARAWRLARELADATAGLASPVAPRPIAAPSPAPIAPHATPPQQRPVVRSWIAAAASVALLAGIGWQLLPSPPASEPVYRGVEARSITSALPPGAGLSRSQPILRWTGPDDARYRARVLTPDLELLEESEELQMREYTLSPDTLRRIRPDGLILWQVEGRVAGETVIVSPTFHTHVP